jgi:hypothetical protein
MTSLIQPLGMGKFPGLNGSQSKVSPPLGTACPATKIFITTLIYGKVFCGADFAFNLH